jgi:FimV-like protein
MALVILAAWGSGTHAAGLGSLRVQSSLGQALHVSIPVVGDDSGDLNAQCVKARVESAEGTFLAGAQVGFSHSGQGTVIQLATHQSINEPAVIVQVDLACGTFVHRTYQVLLDPVVILPQTAQTERAPVAEAKTGLAEQAAITQSTARAIDSPRRSASSHKKERSEAVKPAAADVQVERRKSRKSGMSEQLSAKKVVRNVLRLSGDDTGLEGATFSPGLKMSDTLSESRDTGDPQKAAELRAAHARFLAVLRDEDLVQKGEAQVNSMQAKLQEMEKETERLKQQSSDDRAALEEMRKSWFSPNWITWLILIVLLCIAAISWLMWRLNEAKRRPAFWEGENADPDDTRTDMDDEDATISANWDNTESVFNTIAESTVSSDSKSAPNTDWGSGMPEDTLAAGWAEQQDGLQSDALQSASHADEHLKTIASSRNLPIEQKEAAPAKPKAEPVQEPPAFLSAKQETPASVTKNELASKSHELASMRAKRQAVPAKSEKAPQLQVEEISDLIQQAEFWMLLNDPRRAIDILEPHSAVEEMLSPVPWIYLIDLYRVVGEQDKYETLRARIEKKFNTNVPPWGEVQEESEARSLKDYPHVMQAIQDLWEGDYIIPYLESLLHDDREGDRVGFDLSVYREIIHLIGAAREPDIAKRRAKLVFGKVQPLISQQVSNQPSAGTSGLPALPEEDDAFDKATSLQATSKQFVAKPLSVKPAAPKAPEPKPSAPQIQAPAAPIAEPQVPVLPEAGTSRNAPAAQPKPAAAAAPAPTAPKSSAAPEHKVPASVAAPAIPTPAAKSAASAPAEQKPAVAENATHAVEDEDNMTDMARKLDLAVAYQEIGENVGARVLLEEVIQGGTVLQVERAKSMLKRLLKEIDWQ